MSAHVKNVKITKKRRNMYMPTRKKNNIIRYKEFFINQKLDEYKFKVSEECLMNYLKATECHNPCFTDDNAAKKFGFPNKVIPPTLIGQNRAIKYNLPEGKSRPDGNLHAKHEFHFYDSLRLNEEISYFIKVKDKYIKRGRKYVVFEGVIIGEDHRNVALSIWTFCWGE